MHDGADERQTETSALVPSAQRGVDLLEWFENTTEVLRCNPYPSVANREGEPRFPINLSGNHNGAAWRRELHCIRHQVQQNLLGLLLVTAQRRQVGREVDRFAERGSLNALTCQSLDRANHLAQIEDAFFEI